MGHLRADNSSPSTPLSHTRTNEHADVAGAAAALEDLSINPSQDPSLASAFGNFNLGEQPTADTNSTTETSSPGDTPMTETSSPGDTTPTTETSSPDNSAGDDIPGTSPNHTSIEEMLRTVNQIFGDLAPSISMEVLSPRDRTLTQAADINQAPPQLIHPSARRRREDAHDDENDEEDRPRVRRRLRLEDETAEGSAFAVLPGEPPRTISLEHFSRMFAGANPNDLYPPEYVQETNAGAAGTNPGAATNAGAATNTGAATNPGAAGTNAGAAATDAGAAATDTEQAATNATQDQQLT